MLQWLALECLNRKSHSGTPAEMEAIMLEELYVETRVNVHRGIEFTVARTKTASVWRWHCWIAEEAKTGQTRAKLRLLAIRRVEMIINRELKKRESQSEAVVTIQKPVD
jgi:hypothetical protein